MVTLFPSRAHQIAMSPPIVPPPITWTRFALKLDCLARLFSWSCRKKTRIRFLEVFVSASSAKVSISFC